MAIIKLILNLIISSVAIFFLVFAMNFTNFVKAGVENVKAQETTKTQAQ